MKITNFNFNTSGFTPWPSFDEIYKVTNTLREKKYTSMSVYLAITPKNAEKEILENHKRNPLPEHLKFRP